MEYLVLIPILFYMFLEIIAVGYLKSKGVGILQNLIAVTAHTTAVVLGLISSGSVFYYGIFSDKFSGDLFIIPAVASLGALESSIILLGFFVNSLNDTIKKEKDKG